MIECNEILVTPEEEDLLDNILTLDDEDAIDQELNTLFGKGWRQLSEENTVFVTVAIPDAIDASGALIWRMVMRSDS